MATLADVFRVIDSLRTEGVVENYALGGTIAALFYAEATLCFDLCVCISSGGRQFKSFRHWLRRHRLELREGFVVVHGVPVRIAGQNQAPQLEAARCAQIVSYGEVPVHVMSAEHLIAFNVDNTKSRWGYFSSYFAPEAINAAKLEEILESAGLLSKWKSEREVNGAESPDAHRYAAKKHWHEQNARLPVKEKMAQLLQMQRFDLPLLARHRELKWWEKPWDIEP